MRQESSDGLCSCGLLSSLLLSGTFVPTPSISESFYQIVTLKEITKVSPTLHNTDRTQSFHMLTNSTKITITLKWSWFMSLQFRTSDMQPLRTEHSFSWPYSVIPLDKCMLTIYPVIYTNLDKSWAQGWTHVVRFRLGPLLHLLIQDVKEGKMQDLKEGMKGRELWYFSRERQVGIA